MRKSGLKPSKTLIPEYSDKKVNCTWIWEDYPELDTEAWFIFFLMARDAVEEIVKIAVKFQLKDLLGMDKGDTIDITNSFAVGNKEIESKTKALLLCNKIEPKNLMCVGVYSIYGLKKK